MIGTRLQDRYELTSELGRGGRGVVYKAFDPVLRREIAVKMIPPRQLDREAEQRFSREALLIARMDHPGIVPVYDFGRHEDRLFIVMPLVEGTTLKALIRRGELTLPDILRAAAQIAEALDYGHRQGVVHRDVKPSNVMVARSAETLRTRLMDYGMAQGAGDPRLTDTGNLPGTLFYLSPEQVLSQPLDGRSDLYSLGAVLYECLTGEPPYTGPVYSVLYRIVHEPPPPLRPRLDTVTSELEKVVLGCLAKDPAARPARGQDLAKTLLALLENAPLTLGPAPPPAAEPPSRAPRATRLVGRETELAALEQRLHVAIRGECQLVLVAGAAGVGKSRLVEELAALARGWRVLALRGHFSGRYRSFPHQAFCELIQDFFRLQSSSGSSGTVVSGEMLDFSDLGPRLAALFPQLAEISELRSASTTDNRTGDSPGDDSRSGAHRGGDVRPADVFELLASALARLAGSRPALFLLENLQRAEGSLDMLEYLVRRLSPTPTLIVGTYRPEETLDEPSFAAFVRHFVDDPRFLDLHLEPLGEAAFPVLLGELLGGATLDEPLAARLHEATEGNPLFARELVAALCDSGELCVGDDGRWRLARGAGSLELALPASIQQTLEQRLARLSEPLRELLSTASVLGRNFTESELESLAEDIADFDAALEELLRRGIFEEDRKHRGDRLGFSSGVLCDVLYQGLPRRRRRALHRRAAEQLERHHAGRLERIYPRLVHHFSRAGVIAKTVGYALELTRRSLEASSPEEAMNAASSALELAETDAAALDPAAEAELLLLRARARRKLGQLEPVFADAERACKGFEEVGEPARAAGAALLLAETAWHARRIDAARRWTRRGVDLAHQADTAPALPRLLTLGATLANMRGEYAEAHALLEEVERLEPSGAHEPGEPHLPRGGELTAGLASPIATLDPGRLATDEEAEVAMCVFETLLGSDADGHLLPGLCETWQGSEDGRIFVLNLRRGVRFSDATPLTAAEVRTALERTARLRALDPAPAIAALARLETPSEHQLVCHLREPLPIFPALLTDNRLAIARETAAGAPDGLAGTGPFRLAHRGHEEVVLERNPLGWHPHPARLDKLVFRWGLPAARIADQLRAGMLDLGRDLLPTDLEAIARDARLRRGVVEATRKNTYFVLFNQDGPLARRHELRSVLAGVAASHALVWRALGRLAQPAVGLIPPGVLGHDPGRRQTALTTAEAIARLDVAGLVRPIVLRAAVHPRFQDRYAALTTALFETWAALGVEVEIATRSMTEFLASYREHGGFDLMLGRWNTDYDDPDNFTWIFHSREGIYRRYCSSAAIDALLERARGETERGQRQLLYQQLESHLARTAALIPLFHDVDHRVGGPNVRGLRLRNTYPYVDYARLAKRHVEEGETRSPWPHGPTRGFGGLRVPVATPVGALDPVVASTAEHLEVASCIFETLTRLDDGVRVVPWLAATIDASGDGRSYRFRLRSQLSFHDGRRLTARDVRASFERLLTAESNPLQVALTPIRGARALRRGEVSELEGFKVRSALEFTIELDEPLPFFLVLLSHPALSIVPEESRDFQGSWRTGAVGTGPFRIVHFEPGAQLDLEHNPGYWRAGLPRSERLTFELGATPEQSIDGLRSGRLAIAGALRPTDLAALRRSRDFAATYVEAPRLSTCFLAFNTRSGPLAETATRRALADALDVEGLLRRVPGPLLNRAWRLIPPGLLGWEPAAPVAPRPAANLRGLRLRIGVHPVYLGQYAELWRLLRTALSELGVELEASEHVLFAGASKRGEPKDHGEPTPDLAAMRWIADYPDVDGFVSHLLGSKTRRYPELASSDEVEQLTTRGRHETDPSLRHAIYRQIEETIARDRLLLPLFHEQTYRFQQPQMRGLHLGVTIPEIRYEELYLAA